MFKIPEDIQQQLQEAANASQRQQESRDKALSQILDKLCSISVDTYGVTFEHSQLLNMLNCIATDVKDIRANIGVLPQILEQLMRLNTSFDAILAGE